MSCCGSTKTSYRERAVAEAQKHLTVNQRQHLEEVLRQHEQLFDWKLG